MHLLGGRIELLAAHVLGAVDHLALQVGEVDHVEIDQADAADAGRGQVQPERRAQAAGAHQQHLGRFQLQLALHAHFGHDQVPAVAQDLVVGKRGGCFGRARPRPTRRRCEGTIEIVSPSFTGVASLLQVADVFVVQIHIDEAAQLAFVVENLLAQIGKLRGERAQHFAHGRAGDARRNPACR